MLIGDTPLRKDWKVTTTNAQYNEIVAEIIELKPTNVPKLPQRGEIISEGCQWFLAQNLGAKVAWHVKNHPATDLNHAVDALMLLKQKNKLQTLQLVHSRQDNEWICSLFYAGKVLSDVVAGRSKSPSRAVCKAIEELSKHGT